VADFDDDGDPDLVVVNQNGPARLFENRSDPDGWIGLRLRGNESNRDGIGARVSVHADGRTWSAVAAAGGSFLSSHDPRLLFGTGDAAGVDSVVVRWPSGKRTVVSSPAAGSYHTLEEGE
jgi:hypothetical protein